MRKSAPELPRGRYGAKKTDGDPSGSPSACQGERRGLNPRPPTTLLTGILVCTPSSAVRPWQKRLLSLQSPKWKDREAVPTFVVERALQRLSKSPGRYGWVIESGKDLPLKLTGVFQKSEENYSFTLQVIDHAGTVLVTVKEVCDACTTAEAMERLVALRETLLDRLELLFKVEHAKWKQAQEVKRQAEIEAQRKAELARRERLRRERELLKKPVIKYRIGSAKRLVFPKYAVTPPPKKLWFYTLTGISAVSLIAGITLLAMDDTLTCGGGHREECRERFDTGIAGWSFTLTGLAVGGIAGYLFYTLYLKTEPKVVVTPTANTTSAGLRLSLRF